MAVDITLLFKASVKTVKTRNKALGVPLGGSDNTRDDAQVLLKRGSGARPKSDFSSRAREVVSVERSGGGICGWSLCPESAEGHRFLQGCRMKKAVVRAK